MDIAFFEITNAQMKSFRSAGFHMNQADTEIKYNPSMSYGDNIPQRTFGFKTLKDQSDNLYVSYYYTFAGIYGISSEKIYYRFTPEGKEEYLNNILSDKLLHSIDNRLEEVLIFTDKIPIETEYIKFDFGNYLFYKKCGLLNLFVNLVSKADRITIEAGDIFTVSFTDNSSIEFKVEQIDNGIEKSRHMNTPQYSYSFIFELSGTKLEQLITKKVKEMQCPLGEYILSDSDGEKLRNNVLWIINEK